jgi:predicted GIY-YIG superfamily endonuclease
MYYVYLIKSLARSEERYVGTTADLGERIATILRVTKFSARKRLFSALKWTSNDDNIVPIMEVQRCEQRSRWMMNW